jgi:hypothetical protein
MSYSRSQNSLIASQRMTFATKRVSGGANPIAWRKCGMMKGMSLRTKHLKILNLT